MKKGQLTTLEWFIVGVVVAAVLLVTLCIILPPPGEVDDSVISCLWILLAFDSILAVVFCIHKGIDAKFEKGDMSITLNNPEPNAAGA